METRQSKTARDPTLDAMPKPEPDLFLQAITETIARYAMLSPGERVLAAVSGGADSVASLCGGHVSNPGDVVGPPSCFRTKRELKFATPHNEST